MTQPRRHRGAGMGPIPELLLRQVLFEGLVELAGDEPRIDELVARADSLLQGSQKQWAKDMKAAIRKLAARNSEGPAHVIIGYPANRGVFPKISIILESGSEDTTQATMADILGREFEQIGTPSPTDPLASKSIEHTTIGVEWDSKIQISSWAVAAERSVLLHEVVKHLLIRNKGRLIKGGVRDVMLSESGFQPDPELYPRTGYVPIVRCTMEWELRQTLKRDNVPTRTTLGGCTFSN